MTIFLAQIWSEQAGCARSKDEKLIVNVRDNIENVWVLQT